MANRQRNFARVEKTLAALIRGELTTESHSNSNILEEITDYFTLKNGDTASDRIEELYPSTDETLRYEISIYIDSLALWTNTIEDNEFWMTLYDLMTDYGGYEISKKRLELIINKALFTKGPPLGFSKHNRFAASVLQRKLLCSAKPIRTTYPLLKLFYIRIANYNHRYFPLGGVYDPESDDDCID